METKRVKIFLASSSELKEDRIAFELELSRRNHSWIEKGLYLELVVWENFIDAMSKERLQGEYNKAIAACDLFVMLFFTKVGKYTAEEFEVAFQHFKKNDRPLIYTYFKDSPINTGSINRDHLLSLMDFQKKLDDLGHFYTRFENTEGLLLHFSKQLDKLLDDGFFGSIATKEKTATANSNQPAVRSEPVQEKVINEEVSPQMDSTENLRKNLKSKVISDQERESLMNQKSLLEEKIAFYKEEELISSSPDAKFSLKKRIQKAEENLAEVNSKLNG